MTFMKIKNSLKNNTKKKSISSNNTIQTSKTFNEAEEMPEDEFEEGVIMGILKFHKCKKREKKEVNAPC